MPSSRGAPAAPPVKVSENCSTPPCGARSDTSVSRRTSARPCRWKSVPRWGRYSDARSVSVSEEAVAGAEGCKKSDAGIQPPTTAVLHNLRKLARDTLTVDLRGAALGEHRIAYSVPSRL